MAEPITFFEHILNKGFLQYEEHMGTDMKVLNAARVSFAKRKDGEMNDSDHKLMTYLAEHEHMSPFRHNYLTVRMKAPIFVFRQFMKHRIGSEFNEMSMRYVEVDGDDFFIPEFCRKQAVVNKQGSEGLLDPHDNVEAREIILTSGREAVADYKRLIALGVCREQARTVLPVGYYSEVFWTMSLQAAVHCVRLRSDSHAQLESQDYANSLKRLLLQIWPVATNCLLNLPE